ncbi:MAG TPA: hypothetical protein VFX98_05420, partial [Longimicrobiaceae bacterium]|nr:hypothetical protein [Longimicrobiaceae bacterium]
MNPHADGADDAEPTPAEHAALAALPREARPGRLLEERTVHALRERGLVRPAGWAAVRLPRVVWAAGAAAAVALFAVGVGVGQWLGARGTARVVAAVQAENSRQAALLVQETGSAYVSALSQLAQVRDTAQAAQGREVAVQLLRAAAGELVRIAPDDPVASGILAGFDRARR